MDSSIHPLGLGLSVGILYLPWACQQNPNGNAYNPFLED